MIMSEGTPLDQLRFPQCQSVEPVSVCRTVLDREECAHQKDLMLVMNHDL